MSLCLLLHVSASIGLLSIGSPSPHILGFPSFPPPFFLLISVFFLKLSVNMLPAKHPLILHDFLHLGFPDDYNIGVCDTDGVHVPEPCMNLSVNGGNGMTPAGLKCHVSRNEALGMQTLNTMYKEGRVEQSAENMPYTSISHICKERKGNFSVDISSQPFEKSPFPHFPQESARLLLKSTSTMAGDLLESRMHLSGLKESKGSASLTIFYEGSVNVFDNVSVAEAHAIMSIAAQPKSKCNQLDVSNPFTITPMIPEANVLKRKSIASIETIVNRLSFARADFAYSASLSPLISDQPMVTGSLPQAQKASLTRFFERRKVRVPLNSPYARNKMARSNDAFDSENCNNGSEECR